MFLESNRVLKLLTFFYVLISGVNGQTQTAKHVFSNQIFEIEPYTMTVEYTLGLCLSRCTEANACKAIVYQKKLLVCRLYDSEPDTTKQEQGSTLVYKRDFDVSQEEFCGKDRCDVTECGPIPKVERGKVLGNQVGIGARVKIECEMGERVHYITCQESGIWQTPPACPKYPEPMLEKECKIDDECGVKGSVCRALNDSTKYCFCGGNTRYNNETYACDKGCTLTSSFNEYTNTTIYGFDEFYASKNFTSFNTSKCYKHCKEKFANQDRISASLETLKDDIHTCRCKRVDINQIKDVLPSELRQKTNGETLLSKVCVETQ